RRAWTSRSPSCSTSARTTRPRASFGRSTECAQSRRSPRSSWPRCHSPAKAVPDVVTRKSRQEIDKMRRAGRLVAEVLALVESELRPGITTGELDRLAERHLRAAGATPSFKGYLGGGHYGRGPGAFPASLCISIDDQVVHGIPSERDIQEGQLVSVDAGAIDAMFTLGGDAVGVEADGWTVVTRDGSLAAHFEHTIAITEGGPEILTSVGSPLVAGSRSI